MATLQQNSIEYSFILQVGNREASFMQYQHTEGKITYSDPNYLNKYYKRFKAFYSLDKLESCYLVNICFAIIQERLTGVKHDNEIQANLLKLKNHCNKKRSVLFNTLNVN